MLAKAMEETIAGLGGDMGWVEELQNQKAVRLTGNSRAGQPDCKEKKVQAGAESLRMLELEIENLRLTQLVGELLLKNQRLRESN